MNSMESLRKFIDERLTSAAEEIIGVLEQTLSAYEEEMSRQRKLLDVVLQPEIRLHRTDLPQLSVYKEEAEFHLEQQLCNQESDTNLAQKNPEGPELKDKQYRVPTSLEQEQLVLKQEENFKLTCEESSHNQSRPLDYEKPHGVAEKEPLGTVSSTWIKSNSDPEDSKVEPEPNSDRHDVEAAPSRTAGGSAAC
ncbi:hypothetical protein Q5P01_015119 [Channa striata]|uniref:Uncharacterized protein n=1 Tax=Channa striata TaxID=64152 RepID=A0AA88SII1_CHASR|nr:hypothetical protein Q5P01_015119 [Channa striata]